MKTRKGRDEDEDEEVEERGYRAGRKERERERSTAIRAESVTDHHPGRRNETGWPQAFLADMNVNPAVKSNDNFFFLLFPEDPKENEENSQRRHRRGITSAALLSLTT